MPNCVGVGPQKVGDFGVAQQRFGRDASNVQTHPAPVVGFDDGHRQTQLRGTDGGHVAARTRAEHYDVILHGSRPLDNLLHQLGQSEAARAQSSSATAASVQASPLSTTSVAPASR